MSSTKFAASGWSLELVPGEHIVLVISTTPSGRAEILLTKAGACIVGHELIRMGAEPPAEAVAVDVPTKPLDGPAGEAKVLPPLARSLA